MTSKRSATSRTARAGGQRRQADRPLCLRAGEGPTTSTRSRQRRTTCKRGGRLHLGVDRGGAKTLIEDKNETRQVSTTTSTTRRSRNQQAVNHDISEVHIGDVNNDFLSGYTEKEDKNQDVDKPVPSRGRRSAPGGTEEIPPKEVRTYPR